MTIPMRKFSTGRSKKEIGSLSASSTTPARKARVRGSSASSEAQPVTLQDVVIETRALSRIYTIGDSNLRALDGVNLTIRRGEFVAIMGASGSGKSTLMNLLGCLDRPSSGQYFFDGIDVARLDEPTLAQIRSERIGFVF